MVFSKPRNKQIPRNEAQDQPKRVDLRVIEGAQSSATKKGVKKRTLNLRKMKIIG
jgi:hypothetical protein